MSQAGDVARDAGAAVRDRLRDSARAVERRGRALRGGGMRDAASVAVERARRHRKTLLGTVGAVAGGVLALTLVRRRRG